VLDLAKLIADGRGELGIRWRPRCRNCGTPGKMQVRAPAMKPGRPHDCMSKPVVHGEDRPERLAFRFADGTIEPITDTTGVIVTPGETLRDVLERAARELGAEVIVLPTQ
jgi:hypothetical protein